MGASTEQEQERAKTAVDKEARVRRRTEGSGNLHAQTASTAREMHDDCGNEGQDVKSGTADVCEQKSKPVEQSISLASIRTMIETIRSTNASDETLRAQVSKIKEATSSLRIRELPERLFLSDTRNYPRWKSLFLRFVAASSRMAEQCLVTGTVINDKKVTVEIETELSDLNGVLLFHLHFAMTDAIWILLPSKTSAHSVWIQLEEMCSAASSMALFNAKKEFTSLRMGKLPLESYILKFDRLYVAIAQHENQQMSAYERAAYLVDGLSTDFERYKPTYFMIIEEMSDLTPIQQLCKLMVLIERIRADAAYLKAPIRTPKKPKAGKQGFSQH